MTKLQTAKIFWSGRSQAVRLPKEFRFDATEVTIRREGNAIILEEAGPPKSFDEEWAWLKEVAPFDDDVVLAANEDPGAPTPRPELDDVFK